MSEVIIRVLVTLAIVIYLFLIAVAAAVLCGWDAFFKGLFRLATKIIRFFKGEKKHEST